MCLLADKSLLAQAKEMENNGIDSEVIRHQTKWFKGYDGKWRYELADSDIKIKNTDIVSDVRTLGDVIDAPELFASYPQLKDVMIAGARFDGDAYYSKARNAIVMNTNKLSSMSERENQIRSSDEFKAYDENYKEALKNNNRELAKKLTDEFYSTAIGKELLNLVRNSAGKNTTITDNNKADLLHEIQHAIQGIEGWAKGSDVATAGSYDNYMKTAGEIEARDTANRMNLTEEQRKNTRPDIDRTDVVFAEGGGASYMISDNFSEEFDKALNNDEYYKNNAVVVGKIPNLFYKYGFDTELPLTITAKHLKNITHNKVIGVNRYHGLSKANIINAIKQLEKPALLIESPSNKDVLIAFTTETDSDNIPIAVYINKNGKAYINSNEKDANHILSLYGRENTINFIKSAIKDNRIIDGNKNRADKLQNILGIVLSLPDNILSINSDNSISYNSENSNSFDEKSSDAEYIDYDKPITVDDINQLREIIKAHGGERVSINDFTSEDIQKSQKWAYKFYKELGTKSPYFRAWFGDWRAYENDNNAIITKYGYGEHLPITTNSRKVKNYDTGFEIMVDSNTFGDTLHYASINGDKKQINQVLGRIDEIVKNAVLFDTQISDNSKSNKKGSTSFMHYLYVPITVNNAPFLVKLTVEEYGIESNKRGYNVRRIKMSTLQASQFSKLTRKSRKIGSSVLDSISISDLYSLVKTYDKDFHPGKSVSPLLLNKDGEPRIFYHGTREENGDFTVFDNSKAVKKGGRGLKSYGKGYYFTTIKLGENSPYGSRIIPAYLSIRNPLHIDDIQFELAVKDILGVDASQMSYDEIQERMIRSGYDGIIIEGTNDNRIAVAFNNNQIKSATDNIGTFDSNNKDIRYQYSSEDVDDVVARELAAAEEVQRQRELRAAAENELKEAIAENERLRSEVHTLEEEKKSLIIGSMIDDNKLRKKAVDIRKKYGSSVSSDDFAERMIKAAHNFADGNTRALDNAINSLATERYSESAKKGWPQLILSDFFAEKSITVVQHLKQLF